MFYNISDLKSALDLCLLIPKDNNRSCSIAYSESGEHYTAGRVVSGGKSLSIYPELASLLLAVQHNDFKISKVVTLVEYNDTVSVSPLVLKTLVDYAARVGVSLEYTIISKDGEELFHADDVGRVIEFYRSKLKQLEKTKENNLISDNKVILSDFAGDKKEILKRYAIEGIKRNFPAYDSASGYGAAVLTKNNALYFSGQYSDPDNNTSVHSETAAILGALMDRNPEITHLGIVSTKHRDTPCDLCGRCRQIVAEISNSLNLNIEIFCFARDTEEYRKHTINDYLPSQWSNIVK